MFCRNATSWWHFTRSSPKTYSACKSEFYPPVSTKLCTYFLLFLKSLAHNSYLQILHTKRFCSALLLLIIICSVPWSSIITLHLQYLLLEKYSIPTMLYYCYIHQLCCTERRLSLPLRLKILAATRWICERCTLPLAFDYTSAGLLSDKDSGFCAV